jgi:hypothetical protein
MNPMSASTSALTTQAPRRSDAPRALLLAAPTAALAAGLAAEWLDFRELRVPLLLMVGAGVLLTAHAAFARQPALRRTLLTVVLGVATWAAAETVYVVLHVATGQEFSAERFGPQPAKALGLIAAHGVFLGAPTGAAAALLLEGWRAVAKWGG